MNDILERIGAMGSVSLIKINGVEKAGPLAKALLDGGVVMC
ncbi:MAG TPA: hypothetical protein VIK78_05240 [Ruminiclostridium sp.]